MSAGLRRSMLCRDTATKNTDIIVIGTRGSLLARAQTNWVADRLRAAHEGLEVRIEIIRSA